MPTTHDLDAYVDPHGPHRHGGPLRIGIGGPVGSGKTALVAALCRTLGAELDLAVVTNDIYTTEDADFLLRNAVLPADRIQAVETGCCPHTAIRDDIAANLDAVEDLEARHPGLDLVLVECGGDNLTATFSHGLVDGQIFVIDVAGGDKVPRKGGPGVTTADLLVINKTDLAPLVGADLGVMGRDAAAAAATSRRCLSRCARTRRPRPVAEWVREQVRARALQPREDGRRGGRPARAGRPHGAAGGPGERAARRPPHRPDDRAPGRHGVRAARRGRRGDPAGRRGGRRADRALGRGGGRAARPRRDAAVGPADHRRRSPAAGPAARADRRRRRRAPPRRAAARAGRRRVLDRHRAGAARPHRRGARPLDRHDPDRAGGPAAAAHHDRARPRRRRPGCPRSPRGPMPRRCTSASDAADVATGEDAVRLPLPGGWVDTGVGRRAAPGGGAAAVADRLGAGVRGDRMSLVVRARRVVLPDGERAAAVHTEDGRITAVTAFDDAPAGAVTLADDEVLLPGLVDSHVHVNEPGRTEWEGFATATRAAAAGGVTTIVDMPLNSIPPTTTVEALHVKREAAQGQVAVDVAFWGGAVPGQRRPAAAAARGRRRRVQVLPARLRRARSSRRWTTPGCARRCRARRASTGCSSRTPRTPTSSRPRRTPAAPSYAGFLASRPAGGRGDARSAG